MRTVEVWESEVAVSWNRGACDHPVSQVLSQRSDKIKVSIFYSRPSYFIAMQCN